MAVTQTTPTGNTHVYASGSTLTLSGSFGGTPTGGTLNLSNVSLTLPDVGITPAYVLYGFRNDDERLYIATSNDGINFTPAPGNPVFTAPTGSIRDPRAHLHTDGFVYIAYTTGGFGTSTSFDILKTRNFIQFEIVATVDCSSVSGASQTWSPVWFTDPVSGNTYIFVNIGTGAIVGGTTGNHLTYWLEPDSQSDLTAWGNPTLVTGTSLPTDQVGVSLDMVGNVYFFLVKNDVSGFIEKFESVALFSGYVATGTGNWAGWGTGLEGNAILSISSTQKRVYLDDYPLDGIYYSDTFDNYATFTAKSLISTGGTTLSNPDIVNLRDVFISSLVAYNCNNIGRAEFDVHLSGNQAMAADDFRSLELDTIVIDNYDAFNVVNHTYVAPYSGRLRGILQFGIVSYTSGTTFSVSVFVNGGEKRQIFRSSQTASGEFRRACPFDIPVNRGDIVLILFFFATNGETINGDSNATALTGYVERIGGN